MNPIVDTHQHLWDLRILRLPWLEEVAELRENHVMSTYFEASKTFEVAKMVYMEVDASPDQIEREAEYVLGLCDAPDNPMAGATLRGMPGTDGFADWARQCAADPRVKGLRQVIFPLEFAPDYCLQDWFVADMQLLGELGLHFDLCIRPADLCSARKLAQRCPDTLFVLDHCGNADPEVVNGSLSAREVEEAVYRHDAESWKREIESLGRLPNVVCKISGIIARLPKGKDAADSLAATVNHCLDSFGPDKVVFGSDWPVCNMGASYQAWVEALREIISSRDQSEQRKLLADNALRLYRLQAEE